MKQRILLLALTLSLFIPVYTIASPNGGGLEEAFPSANGDRARYNVQIDFKKAYISGICIMLMEDDVIKASVVNEFGVSALDFTYNPAKQKVKILKVMGNMNKWYIKKVLKKDLKQVMTNLPLGNNTYEDTKYSIKYTFDPLDETKE